MYNPEAFFTDLANEAYSLKPYLNVRALEDLEYILRKYIQQSIKKSMENKESFVQLFKELSDIIGEDKDIFKKYKSELIRFAIDYELLKKE